MALTIREATAADAPVIVQLIRELAEGIEEKSPLTEAYAAAYLGFPGSGALLAEEEAGTKADASPASHVVGLLSYSVRPGLFHGANSALIEDLIVAAGHRGQGIGHSLLAALLARLEEEGCAEVSVTTMPGNAGALRFYRSHGLTDEAVYLEKHFGKRA